MLASVFGFPAPTAEQAVRAAVAAAADHHASANGNSSRTSGPAARANEFLGELARRVAAGVASVAVVLDPGLVVLGGDVGLAGGAALASRVAAEVARICPARPRVVPTAVTGGRSCAAPCSPPWTRPVPTCSTPSRPVGPADPGIVSAVSLPLTQFVS